MNALEVSRCRVTPILLFWRIHSQRLITVQLYLLATTTCVGGYHWPLTTVIPLYMALPTLPIHAICQVGTILLLTNKTTPGGIKHH